VKYIQKIGYGVLFSASMMMLAGMAADIKAEENDEITVPVEIISDSNGETEATLTNKDEPLIEEMPIVEEVKEENESTEPALSEAAKNEVNNGIPVIYLNIDESRGTIDAMNSDPKHNTYCYGTLDFKLPSSDFTYTDLNTVLQDYSNLDMQIRGRGNSTWTAEKKPYKIKLDKKTDLLGQGKDEKNKHCVLIANQLDPTLVKDRLTGYIGD